MTRVCCNEDIFENFELNRFSVMLGPETRLQIIHNFIQFNVHKTLTILALDRN